MTWTLVLHGGSGAMRRGRLSVEDDAAARAGLNAALDRGSAILAGGGSALDAVEAAACVLEDDPAFNAARGAVLTQAGGHSLDAAIMDGADGRAGAVAGSTVTRHPISLARATLTIGPHVFLSGDGADEFAREQGLEQVAPDWFTTPERHRQWQELNATGTFDAELKYGTIGVVARDEKGRLAAATSTGGLTGKRWGRIGDSPVIGAGTWADGAVAVSATGSGEHFLRLGLAHEIAARVRLAGDTPAAATDRVMTALDAIGGKGGVIVVGAEGGLWRYSTPGMYRARADAAGARVVAIYDDED